jgi:hypothetical protein
MTEAVMGRIWYFNYENAVFSPGRYDCKKKKGDARAEPAFGRPLFPLVTGCYVTRIVAKQQLSEKVRLWYKID